ncbi:LysR family transcriptional regulator [Rhodococcoides fascians]|uniref:LysR family transcriptional regulator n=1 Tax=Rhodococcoides fascians TaxID=1828 RepID=UPI00055EAA95|nr:MULTISPECIES: LysR family transcriptional regulator [Rhodococcus]OZE95490.1 LysR family transcriptional regulator [Rhodococcus sp. 15-1189-1-1a]OZF10121.1 LysR family transcriptional regulator [Rhodococcus sp. 14-2686-1-2]
MELRHLQHFVAVAEERHFGRAATRLGLAQPAVSQSVRQLEKELGVALFERTTRQVRRTPAGEFFYRETVRNLDGLAHTRRSVRRIAAGRQGLIRLGFTGTSSFDRLPVIARTAKQRMPGVALEIHGDLLTPALVDGLRSGQLDLAVLRPPVAGTDIVVRTIAEESLVAALPIDHRLSVEPVLAITDLAQEDFVMYSDPDSAVNDAVARCCRAAGFTPRRQHAAPGTSVLLALVAAGLGIALVPESARALPLGGVTFREIENSGTVDLALAWNESPPSALVNNLLSALDVAHIPTSDRAGTSYVDSPDGEGVR